MSTVSKQAERYLKQQAKQIKKTSKKQAKKNLTDRLETTFHICLFILLTSCLLALAAIAGLATGSGIKFVSKDLIGIPPDISMTIGITGGILFGLITAIAFIYPMTKLLLDEFHEAAVRRFSRNHY